MLLSAITRGERQVMPLQIGDCTDALDQTPTSRVTMLLQNLSAGQLHSMFAANTGGKMRDVRAIDNFVGPNALQLGRLRLPITT